MDTSTKASKKTIIPWNSGEKEGEEGYSTAAKICSRCSLLPFLPLFYSRVVCLGILVLACFDILFVFLYFYNSIPTWNEVLQFGGEGLLTDFIRIQNPSVLLTSEYAISRHTQAVYMLYLIQAWLREANICYGILCWTKRPLKCIDEGNVVRGQQTCRGL